MVLYFVWLLKTGSISGDYKISVLFAKSYST